MTAEGIKGPPPQEGLSAVWILTYLPLHMFWQQCVTGPNVYLLLRIPFLIVIFAFLLKRGGLEGVRSLQFLRLPSPIAFAGFLLATLAVRYGIEVLFPYTQGQAGWGFIIESVVIAPINEELLFRLVFLNILIGSLEVRRSFAVFLSAFIFAVCHNLERSNFFAVLAGGIVYGIICVHPKGGVLLCIICHACWNGYALFIDS